YADRKAPLQLRDQIARLRYVERARRDEQDVVRRHHAVARIHRRPFDDGQDVTLHALARDVRPVAAFTPSHLVDLIQKNDAGVFHAVDSHTIHLIDVDQPLLLFLHQVFEGLAYLHLPLLGPLAEESGKNVPQVDVHLFLTLVSDDLKARRIPLAHVNLHRAVVQLALAELLPQLLPRALVAVTRVLRCLNGRRILL